MMRRIVSRIFLSGALIAVSGCLLWYGICSNRIAEKDWGFQTRYPWMEVFPEVLLLKGSLAYFVDLNADAAADYFRRAIQKQPGLIEAWIGLAKSEQALGHEKEAREVVDRIAPLISHVSTWKWQELLLAFEMHNEDQFAACFNFVLTRLPYRVADACYLALEFWGSWEATLPHVEQGGRVAFLGELKKAGQVDVSLALWDLLESSGSPIEEKERLSFCEFLLARKELGAAIEVWKSSGYPGAGTGVFDGGFESQPMNKAFGWKYGDSPDFLIERSVEQPYEGAYCLHVHFYGNKNLSFRNVSQIVPVEPDRAYTLDFARKSRNLTTDQGVFVEVAGFGCSGLLAKSEPVVGTSAWLREELTFFTPPECKAVKIELRRAESLKFDNKISGDYWLDALELKLDPDQGESAQESQGKSSLIAPRSRM